MCSDTKMAKIWGKYVLQGNGIDPFVTLKGSLLGDPFHVTTSFLESLVSSSCYTLAVRYWEFNKITEDPGFVWRCGLRVQVTRFKVTNFAIKRP